MATSIQVTETLQKELSKKKIYEKETYEEVIWDLIEDSKEITEETKRDLQRARNDFRQGRFSTLEQVKRRLGK